MRVLSGIQPSGTLHIGNYFGMMKPMIAYQDRSDLFVFIVNLHALTTLSDAEALKKNTIMAAADFLALGLDPEKCTFWVQGDVPEVTELTWVLHNVTSMGLLERCHSYKDKIAKGLTPNHGLFAYPVLMAADILALSVPDHSRWPGPETARGSDPGYRRAFQSRVSATPLLSCPNRKSTTTWPLFRGSTDRK